MSKETDSDKVAQTKQKIKETFIELYKVKTIDNISVKEITNRAGFNRGTFYIHYQDIYDLLGQIEQEILLEFDKIGGKIKDFDISGFDENKPMPAMLEFIECIKRNSKYLEVFFGINGGLSFVIKMKQLMKPYVLAKIKHENKEYGEHSDYLLEYIASANIGIFIYWIQTGMDLTTEELAIFLGRTIFKGPLH